MNDMTAVIVPKSDQINADDLLSGPITITIDSVIIRPGTEQPVSIFFNGQSKPYKPCKSMARVMVALWGPDASQYVGKSMTLFRDSKVQWGGMDVGGIRISHMSDISGVATLPLTVTKGKKAPFVVKPLSASAPASTEPAQSVEDRVARFLANLKTKLATCETREQVEAVAVSKQVKATLDGAPIGVRTQINGIVAAALERFPVVVDAAEIDEEVPF